MCRLILFTLCGPVEWQCDFVLVGHRHCCSEKKKISSVLVFVEVVLCVRLMLIT